MGRQGWFNHNFWGIVEEGTADLVPPSFIFFIKLLRFPSEQQFCRLPDPSNIKTIRPRAPSSANIILQAKMIKVSKMSSEWPAILLYAVSLPIKV